MDLKIVWLLFGCLLSIALAEGEEEPEDGGSQEKGPSEECKCDRRHGGHGWGEHGGKYGEKKCFPISLCHFEECEDFNKKLCETVDKEEMRKCWEMETVDDKKKCKKRILMEARKKFGEESFPECGNAVHNFINLE